MGVACCQVQVSASCRSLVQRSPTECVVSECKSEASIMRRHWPTGGCSAMGGKNARCRFTHVINRLTPNDPYMGHTAPLTSKRCILYIYSTNTGTEYFKHALYSPFLSLQNAVCFIMLTCLVPVLFTFYIQVC